MIKGTATMKPAAPLGMAYIAGAIKRDHHQLQVIDGIAENIYDFHDTELGKNIIIQGMSPEQIVKKVPEDVEVIGLSCMFSNNWLLDRRLIQLLKQRFQNAVLVAGGESISGMPEYALKDSLLDVCVVGEGEEVMCDLLRALETGADLSTVKGIVYKKEGKIFTNPRRERIRDLDQIAFPAWEYFPTDAYFKYQITWMPTTHRSLPMLATRGCPYTCTFCSSPQMWTTKYSLRSPENILSEMVSLYEKFGVTNFELFDLTAVINRHWVLEFSKLLQRHPVKFTWQMPAGTRSEALNSEVIQQMALGGCTNITFAPESGSSEVLKSIQKKADPAKMLPAMKTAAGLGMYIYLNTIIGLPGEKHEDVWKTIVFLLKAAAAGADDTGVGVFMPYPGSQLFREMERSGTLMLNDEFFYDILKIDSFGESKFFNKEISPAMYRFYNVFMLLAFYACSFTCRPMRLFKTVRNVAMKNYVTRSEKTLGYLLEQLSEKKPRLA
jgi:radical SAM superfamily enzyme YgiQ (UPF0313 family)